jgi:hypothetical protein
LDAVTAVTVFRDLVHTGHELSEARTDPPTPGAWYDSSGSENGDKWAWKFNVPPLTFTNGSQWKIQSEWSNAAYTAGTGYPNSRSEGLPQREVRSTWAAMQ